MRYYKRRGNLHRHLKQVAVIKMPLDDNRPFIFVLAGVNGAGKSSVGGHLLADVGLTWYNPDSFARELIQLSGITQEEANSQAWEYGRAQLENAIQKKLNFAFETTLGANTIPKLLLQATKTHHVMVWFCGLSSPEQHIARVNKRVANGGHAIPEQKIHERWANSRINLIKLMPHLTYLQVFDNSQEVADNEDIPAPVLILEMQNGKLLFPSLQDTETFLNTPDWAKPMVQAAIELGE